MGRGVLVARATAVAVRVQRVVETALVAVGTAVARAWVEVVTVAGSGAWEVVSGAVDAVSGTVKVVAGMVEAASGELCNTPLFHPQMPAMVAPWV